MSISLQGAKLVPIFVFKIIWFFVVLLYLFSPYPFHSISIETWIIILLSFLVVLIGYYTQYFFDSHRKAEIYSPYRSENILRIDQKKLELTLTISLFLVSIGIFGDLFYLSYLISSYGLDPSNIFWYRFFMTSFVAQSTEWDIIHSLLNYLILLNNLVVILSGIYYCFEGKKKVLIYGPILLALIYSIFTLQRNTLISNLVYWFGSIFFISFFLATRKQNLYLKKLLKIIFIFVFFMSLIIFLIIIIRFNIDLGGRFSEKLVELGIQNIYSYLPGNIVALDHYLKSDISFKNGAFFLRDVLKWISRIGLVEAEMVPLRYMEFTNVGSTNMNTYTYIRIFYDDFGVIGLLIMSYIWGFLGSFIVTQYFKKFRLYRLILVVLIFFSFFISFFTFSLHNLTMILLLLLLTRTIETYLRIEDKSNNENSPLLSKINDSYEGDY